jgi:CRP-like cAMP-binding protein
MDSQALAEVPLFEGLSDEELAACAAPFQEIEVLSDHNVAREGDDSYAFFIVLDGQLAVHVDFNEIATLGPGEFFGEMGLEDKGKRSAHVASRGRVKLAKLMTWDYEKMIADHPVVKQRIAAVAAERAAENG